MIRLIKRYLVCPKANSLVQRDGDRGWKGEKERNEWDAEDWAIDSRQWELLRLRCFPWFRFCLNSHATFLLPWRKNILVQVVYFNHSSNGGFRLNLSLFSFVRLPQENPAQFHVGCPSIGNSTRDLLSNNAAKVDIAVLGIAEVCTTHGSLCWMTIYSTLLSHHFYLSSG